MRLFEKVKGMMADAAAKVVADGPGVAQNMAQKAMAFGAAAASATASAAASALEATKEFAAEKLKGHFSDIDVEQGAEVLEMTKVGVQNPDGTFRLLTAEERHDITRLVLVATLEEDDRPAADPEDGQD